MSNSIEYLKQINIDGKDYMEEGEHIIEKRQYQP